MKLDRTLLLLLFFAGALLVSFSPKPAIAAEADTWRVPLDSPVLAREFLQPSADWSAGHRGVDYLASPNQSVYASHAGTVTFTGVVVNREVVTIEHGGGLKTSYEPVCSTIAVGTKVSSDQVIGEVCPNPNYPSHCGSRICLHFSMRNQNGYLSPLVMIGGLSPSRLKPLDGRTCSLPSGAQC